MNIKEIYKLLEDCDEPSNLTHNYEGYTALFTLAHEGEEYCEHKTCYTETVLQEIATGDYYEITTSRSNSGYWSDSESFDPEIRAVKPVKKVVETTEWHNV